MAAVLSAKAVEIEQPPHSALRRQWKLIMRTPFDVVIGHIGITQTQHIQVEMGGKIVFNLDGVGTSGVPQWGKDDVAILLKSVGLGELATSSCLGA